MNGPELTIAADALTDVLSQVSDSLLSCAVTESHQQGTPEGIGQPQARACAITLSHQGQVVDVVAACSRDDAATLALRMTGKGIRDLTDKLVEDALCEWLNIMAGQIKSLAGLDHMMGLPRVLTASEKSELMRSRAAQGMHIELGELQAALWLGLVGKAGITVSIGG